MASGMGRVSGGGSDGDTGVADAVRVDSGTGGAPAVAFGSVVAVAFGAEPPPPAPRPPSPRPKPWLPSPPASLMRKPACDTWLSCAMCSSNASRPMMTTDIGSPSSRPIDTSSDSGYAGIGSGVLTIVPGGGCGG
jgi:hypothetical protein